MKNWEHQRVQRAPARARESPDGSALGWYDRMLQYDSRIHAHTTHSFTHYSEYTIVQCAFFACGSRWSAAAPSGLGSGSQVPSDQPTFQAKRDVRRAPVHMRPSSLSVCLSRVCLLRNLLTLLLLLHSACSSAAPPPADPKVGVIVH